MKRGVGGNRLRQKQPTAALGIIIFLAITEKGETADNTTLNLRLVFTMLRAETVPSLFQVWSCQDQPSEESLMAFLFLSFLFLRANVQKSFSPKHFFPHYRNSNRRWWDTILATGTVLLCE